MNSYIGKYLPLKNEYLGLQTAIELGVTTLLISTLIWLWGKTFRRLADRKIAVFKFPWWSFQGTFYFLPSSQILRQQSLSRSACMLQLILAHNILYPKEDLFAFWVGFCPFLFPTKGLVAEEILNSNTILDKAWSYKMLHPWLGQGLLTSSGSKWRTRRKLLTPSFHFEILKDFQFVFDEQSKILVDILEEQCHKEWVDIIPYITRCSLDIICESTLGAKCGAQRNTNAEYVLAVQRATNTAMERMFKPEYWSDFIYNFLPVGRQFKKDIRILHEFTRKIIREKKAALMQQKGAAELNSTSVTTRKRKALMDLLLNIHLSDQKLTEDDIAEEIDTFAFEGHDTTSAGISWALYFIGHYPDVQAKIHEELDQIFGDDTESAVTMDELKHMHYLECVLKESQRICPSVPMFGRQVQKDCDYRGCRIRKGTVVTVAPYLIHRDPEVFPEPEKFDPSRFFPENCVGRNAYAYIPFSAGPRNCIGQRFAMLEEKTVIAHILRNFSLQSVDPRDRICPTADLILHPIGPLKIKIRKREIP